MKPIASMILLGGLLGLASVFSVRPAVAQDDRTTASAEAGLRSGVALGSEAAQSGHVRRVLAADECYYGQQPDAARRCDQPTMSLPHETALHFLILIVRARLVNGAAALRNLTGASGSVAYAGGPSAGGPMARTADDTTLARADPGPGRSAAGVQRSSDPIRNGGRKD